MHHIKSEISTFHLSLAAPEFNQVISGEFGSVWIWPNPPLFFFLASVAQDDFAETQPAHTHSMRERLQSH